TEARELDSAIRKFAIYDNLQKFEEKTSKKIAPKKLIASQKRSPKRASKKQTFHYEKITKNTTLKNSKVKTAKISIKKMEKINRNIKDSLSLPTHKGIEVFAFKVKEEIKSINLASLWEKTQTQIAKIELKEDRISIALAANEKSPSKMTTQKEASTNERAKEDNLNSGQVETTSGHEVQSELVLLDYSKVEKAPSLNETSLPTKSQISKVEEFQKPESSSIKMTKLPQAEEIVVKATKPSVEDELIMFDMNKAVEEVKKSKAKVA